MFRTLACVACALLSCGPVLAGDYIPGIGPAGKIIQRHTGFIFTEGPAVDYDGNVFFTDVQASRIYVTDTNGKLSVVAENTNRTNGLMFDRNGLLIACQGGARRMIAIDLNKQSFRVLADNCYGEPYIGPNDLVVDRLGGTYFTDPNFGGGTPTQGVYYLTRKGKVVRLIDDLPRPNGVILSPDGGTLYVGTAQPSLMAYPILGHGILGPGVRIGQVANAIDGLTVDTNGILYVTQPGMRAVQVMTPEGETLGFFRFPESPSNVKFGGPDLRTLFVTARTSIYAVPMESQGFFFGVP